MKRIDIETYQELERLRQLGRQRRERDAARQRQREERRKIEAAAERNADDDFRDLMTLTAAAEYQRLQARIDAYETATVAALLENEEAREAAHIELRALLDRAAVLPDGRRVFRTEDGRQVFDERGNEVDREELDPNSIPDHVPRWEVYVDQLDRIGQLEKERRDILEYQARLDEARDRRDEGDLTQDDLDDMAADLERDMPAAVRKELGETAPGVEAGFGPGRPSSPHVAPVATNQPRRDPEGPLPGGSVGGS